MKIKWLGHASFLITSDTGTRIITDPYTPDARLKYGDIKESADIVTASHEHGDHNNVAAVKGKPEVLKGAVSKETKGVKVKSTMTFHDPEGGKLRGPNAIFCFEVDGVKVCHLGDLGHQLSDKEVAALGKTDIILAPVGGNYTIDAKVATEVCDKLSAKVIIPMHYQNERCSTFPVAGVDEFLQGKKNVSKPGASEMEFKKGKLPATTQIIVLKPAL